MPESSFPPLPARYQIERLLGQGGMGRVYLARDVQLDRLVAVKVLGDEVADDPALRERFVREMRVAASFSHPNIVPVFAVEEGEGLLACTMGYVEGESVADRVARSGPLGSRELVRLLLDVAYALAYAHGRDVVHRDLKPDNVMLERATGRALLMDFGIARRMNNAPAQGLTRVGEVVGTPTYMSPEQIAGEGVDGRSDLYALGLLAIYAATGRHIMDAPNTMQVLTRQLTELPPSLATLRPDLPAALCEVVDACLAKEAVARPADARTLLDALERAQEAAPELPLSLRLFAQELGTMSLVTVLVVVLLVSYVANAADRIAAGNLNALVIAVVGAVLLVTRLLQVAGELRAFARAGWEREDIRAGLHALMAERAALRLQLAGNAEAIASRRGMRRTATIMAVIGVVSMAIAVVLQRRLAREPWLEFIILLLVFNGVACLAVSVPLAVRNPLREGPASRAFRGFWLGWPGRVLFRIAWPRAATVNGRVRATGGMAPPPRSGAVTRPSAAVRGAPATPPVTEPPPEDRAVLERVVTLLDAIEKRVSTLERRGAGD